jgi:hypothetical protein
VRHPLQPKRPAELRPLGDQGDDTPVVRPEELLEGEQGEELRLKCNRAGRAGSSRVAVLIGRPRAPRGPAAPPTSSSDALRTPAQLTAAAPQGAGQRPGFQQSMPLSIAQCPLTCQEHNRLLMSQPWRRIFGHAETQEARA